MTVAGVNLTDGCRVLCGFCKTEIDDAAPFADHLEVCPFLNAEWPELSILNMPLPRLEEPA